MLKLITGPVEILSKDPELQNYPICNDSGFTIGSGETYKHALEIKEAVSNYNRVLSLLSEAKKLMGSKGDKARKIQKKITIFLHKHELVCA